jgi:2'-5' RNA ligase
MMAETGIMIACYLPVEIASNLAIEGGELPEDLHLTLVYLGESDQVSFTLDQVQAVVETVASSAPALSGQISGIGLFIDPDQAMPNAFYASFDCTSLPAFRQSLVSALAGAGIESNQEHGYSPHITLEYIPTGDTELPMTSIEITPLTFESISLVWADQRTDYPFQSVTTKAANYNAKAGGVIAGNLARGNDGKFASAGKTTAKTDAAKTATDAAKAAIKSDAKAKTDAEKLAAKDKIAQAKKEDELTTAGDTLDKVAPDFTEVFTVGDSVGDISGANQETLGQLKTAGLAQTYEDGSTDLSPTGRAFISAAKKGDAKTASRLLARAKRIAVAKAAIAARKAAPKKRKRKEVQATSLTVFKSAGQYRWVTFTSSGYQDRDSEWVRATALEQDVVRKQTLKEYGPLLWWHVPGLPIGSCDFRAMSGSILIESGVFINNQVAKAFENNAGGLGVSAGFNSLPGEPGQDRSYSYFDQFERSVLPKHKASNLLSKLFVRKKEVTEMSMLPGKIKELINLMGGGNDAIVAVTEIVKSAQDLELAATGAGITKKEAGAGAGMDGQPTDQPAATGSNDEGSMVGELPVAELQKLIMASLQPVIDAVQALASGQASVTKSTSDHATNLQTLMQTVQALQVKVGELEGGVPAGVQKGHQASTSPATITTTVAKEAGPAPDPLGNFVNTMFNVR